MYSLQHPQVRYRTLPVQLAAAQHVLPGASVVSWLFVHEGDQTMAHGARPVLLQPRWLAPGWIASVGDRYLYDGLLHVGLYVIPMTWGVTPCQNGPSLVRAHSRCIGYHFPLYALLRDLLMTEPFKDC